MSKIKRSKHSSEEFSSSSCSSSSVSSDEETNAQDLKPIKDYLSNRRELGRQLFKSVKPEKIRMMLPHTLKRVNLGALEELCVNELSGMSKTRILSVLNGKPMVESSETDETDDSGPSLEIISDTEEWFTDEDICKNEDGSVSARAKARKDKVKVKRKTQALTKGEINKSKLKANFNTNEKIDDKQKIKIKAENDKDKGKEKEGDSLLDLLELEMRARAIRALIRKEEDFPNTNPTNIEKSSDPSTASEGNTMQDDMRAKENCRRQLEKIISAQQGNPEDEDVVLVVQPTPTIELLSSDSETDGHNGSRINKKLENERIAKPDKTANNEYNADNSVKNSTEQKGKEHEDSSNKQKSSYPTDDTDSIRTSGENLESSQSHLNRNGEKKKKSNKRSRVKDNSKATKPRDENKSKPVNDKQNVDNSETASASPIVKRENEQGVTEKSASKCLEDKPIEVEKSKSKAPTEEEKFMDMEEIIDLDNYSDDIEDIENYSSDKTKSKPIVSTEQPQKAPHQKQASAETWASRYYQTDDVQNVIKESKIQSEIRKRLRERQRLSKLNKSPNTVSPAPSSISDTTSDKPVQKPTGSVDEYLALKRGESLKLSSESNSSDSNVVDERNCDSRLVADSMSEEKSTQESAVEKKSNSDSLTANNTLSTESSNVADNTEGINIHNKTNPT